MEKIIVDKDGNVINIGDWDFQKTTALDKDGNEIEVILNPLPEGAIESEGELVTEKDGSVFVKDSKLHKAYLAKQG